jgi:hypothetical protein
MMTMDQLVGEKAAERDGSPWSCSLCPRSSGSPRPEGRSWTRRENPEVIIHSSTAAFVVGIMAGGSGAGTRHGEGGSKLAGKSRIAGRVSLRYSGDVGLESIQSESCVSWGKRTALLLVFVRTTGGARLCTGGQCL